MPSLYNKLTCRKRERPQIHTVWNLIPHFFYQILLNFYDSLDCSESSDPDQDPMLLKYQNRNYQVKLCVRTCFSIYCYLEQDKGICTQDVISRTCCWYVSFEQRVDHLYLS